MSMKCECIQRWGILLILLAGLSACVRVEAPRAQYAKSPPLMIAKDLHGVQLQWQSEKGSWYTIQYQDPASSDPQWQALPNYQEVKGTGQMMLVQLNGPVAMRRDYRIRAPAGVTRRDN